MKKTLLIFLILWSSLTYGQNEPEMIRSGTYQGKNLYVQNPYSGSGDGFCVSKVFVNDSIYDNGKINETAFEINFSLSNINIGDSVEVKIVHKNDCLPKILNPENLTTHQPRISIAKFDIGDSTIHICFESKGDVFGIDSFYIEQYRWNRWNKVKTFYNPENKYCFEFYFYDYYTGENAIRVKYFEKTNSGQWVEKYNFERDQEKVDYTISQGLIIFSRPTLYELYDTFGNKIISGKGKTVKIFDLDKGLYYLNYDNTTGEVIKIKK